MIQLPAISVLATLGVDDASDPVRVDAYLADEIDDVVLETRASGPHFSPRLIDVLARREDGSGGLLLKGMTTVPDGGLHAAYFFVPAPVAKQSLGQTPTPADLDVVRATPAELDAFAGLEPHEIAEKVLGPENGLAKAMRRNAALSIAGFESPTSRAFAAVSGRDLGDESAHADAPVSRCACGHVGTPADPHAAACEDGYAPEDRASLEPRIALDEPTDREKAITMLAFGDPKRLSDTRLYLELLELAPNVVPYHAMSADVRAVFDARVRYESGSILLCDVKPTITERLEGSPVVREDNAALLEAGKPTAGEEAQRKAWAIARERGQLPNDPLALAQKEHEHRAACTDARCWTCHPEAARAADAIARAERAARLEAQLADDEDDEAYNARRDRAAEILTAVASEGLLGPRDLDGALDALECAYGVATLPIPEGVKVTVHNPAADAVARAMAFERDNPTAAFAYTPHADDTCAPPNSRQRRMMRREPLRRAYGKGYHHGFDAACAEFREVPSSDSRYYGDSSARRGRKMVAALVIGAGVGVIAAEIARRWSAR